MNNEFWKNKIQAFLHDSPDKVLKIKGHDSRVKDILGDQLKFRKDRGTGKTIKECDETASQLQRIDLEYMRSGSDAFDEGQLNLSSQFYKVHGKNFKYIGEPVLRHPITGSTRRYQTIEEILPKSEPILADSPKVTQYNKEFDEILNKILGIEKDVFCRLVMHKDYNTDYFRLWRLYPDLLKRELNNEWSGLGDEFISLTAYTLSPDHTLFDHADATSSIFGVSAVNKTHALLMFKISPVQDFIKTARKEKDLWGASHLLSYLTFSAIRVIVDEYGPDAIVFPHLRGQPFFDKEYEEYFELEEPGNFLNGDKDRLKIANIPNKFLAIIPWEDVERIKGEAKESIHEKLLDIFNFTWNEVLTPDIIKDTKKSVEYKIHELKKERKLRKAEDLEDITAGLFENNNRVKIKEEYKEDIKKIILNHFTITIVSIPNPLTDNELKSNKEEKSQLKKKSYEKFKKLIEESPFPENTKNKYLTWLDFLSDPDTSSHPASSFDLYSLTFEILEDLMDIGSRNFKKIEEEGGWKCTLCGEHTAIGGENYSLMKTLWEELHETHPYTFKHNESLCPVCFIKRSYPHIINEKWGLRAGFESVSKVALRKNGWLQEVENSGEYRQLIEKLNNSKFKNIVSDEDQKRLYNPEFLYLESWTSKNLKEELNIKAEENELEQIKELIRNIHGERDPEKYYSILVMDGDQMGKLIAGDEMKSTDNYLHPNLLEHLPQEIESKSKELHRLITPATHTAISRSLMNFSVNKLKSIIEKNRGELIYSGGDDVLALLPVDNALKAACKIEKVFETEWDSWELLPGKTMSAGLLIVHYKHPLYDALDKVNKLKEKAKDSERNAISIGQLKRSGAYRDVTFNWGIYEKLFWKEDSLVQFLLNSKKGSVKFPNLSARIIYDIVENVENWPNGEKAVKELLKYELSRHYNTSAKEEEKRGEINQLLESINKISKGLRVILNQQEIDEAEVQLTSDLKTLNSELNNAIRENRGPEEVLESFFSTKDLPKVSSIIMKKQIKGTFVLLKILLECAEVEE